MYRRIGHKITRLPASKRHGLHWMNRLPVTSLGKPHDHQGPPFGTSEDDGAFVRKV